MRLLLILAVFLQWTAATVVVVGTSVVITSRDVDLGLHENQLLSLQRDQAYRVYATYAADADVDAYMTNVKIESSNGFPLNVAALARPTEPNGYVLPGGYSLIAPIKITDANPNVPKSSRPAFTIYLVALQTPAFEVLSTQFVNSNKGPVHCNAKENVGCTILSAEPAFRLGGYGSGIWITPTGFDDKSTGAQHITTSSNDAENSIIVSGPIATIRSNNVPKGGLDFVLARNPPWNENLSPGASTSLLSNGWFSIADSYSMPVNDRVRSRTLTFPREVRVTLSSELGYFFPEKGDSAALSCTRADGSSTIYKVFDLIGKQSIDYCTYLSLEVVTTSTTGGPRFKVDIVSGASTVTLLASIVLSLWRALAN